MSKWIASWCSVSHRRCQTDPRILCSQKNSKKYAHEKNVKILNGDNLRNLNCIIWWHMYNKISFALFLRWKNLITLKTWKVALNIIWVILNLSAYHCVFYYPVIFNVLVIPNWKLLFLFPYTNPDSVRLCNTRYGAVVSQLLLWGERQMLGYYPFSKIWDD